jgi:uncharacterized protein YggE
VLNALRQLLGPNADLRTISYSVSPNYRSAANGPPLIVGYTANNTIEIGTADLMVAGRIIDVATQAGATNVGGLRFTLKDPDPARQEALKLATRQAKVHAEALASGLGVRLGAILAVSEGFTVPVVSPELRGGSAVATTPIESGPLEVRASVTLEIEIIQ